MPQGAAMHSALQAFLWFLKDVQFTMNRLQLHRLGVRHALAEPSQQSEERQGLTPDRRNGLRPGHEPRQRRRSVRDHLSLYAREGQTPASPSVKLTIRWLLLFHHAISSVTNWNQTICATPWASLWKVSKGEVSP